jgi:hypothetical protein
MLDYRVTFERTTTVFWFFKKTERFFYNIMVYKAKPPKLLDNPTYPRDYTAVAYEKSCHAPCIKYKSYTTAFLGDTENDAFKYLVKMIEKQTNSTMVDKVKVKL